MDARLTRRTFLQMAAVAITCSEALAAAGSKLRAEVKACVEGDWLVAALTLHNDGASELNVLLGRGSRSAIDVDGWLGRVALAPEPEGEDREMLTRAGPRLVWRPVPAGAALAAGSFRFQFPRQVRKALPAEANFGITVRTHEGEQRILASEVPIGSP